MSDMSLLPAQQENLGRNPVPMNLLKERREMEISLKLAGLSMQSISKEVNRLNSTKNWGNITLRTLERDIVSYYKENKVLNSDDKEYLKGLREIHLAQMENTSQEMALHIAKKDKDNNWKPFEKAIALEKLYKMQIGFAELQGWNLSRNNVLFNINNNNNNTVNESLSNNLKIYDRGMEGIRNADKTVTSRIADLIERVIQEREESEGRVLDNGNIEEPDQLEMPKV